MVSSFAGDIASTSDGWQRYGIHLGGMDDDEDDDMGGFAFYPKLFIQPLRKKIETQLQFQEMMSVSIIARDVNSKMLYNSLCSVYLFTAFSAVHRICDRKTEYMDGKTEDGTW